DVVHVDGRAPVADLDDLLDVAGLDERVPDDHLAQVGALLGEQVELLDAGVGHRVVVRVGVRVDRAAHGLLGAGGGADDPVLDLGDPAAVRADRAGLGGHALAAGRDLDGPGPDPGLAG